jgi:hypothetical protein
MRGAITNKIGNSEVHNLPFHRLKEAGHSPAWKKKDKQYDLQCDVGEFQDKQNSELPHLQNAYLFNISFFFNRLAWNTHNLLKRKQNQYDERGNNKQDRNCSQPELTDSSSEEEGRLARCERRRQTV